jgi:hypothetical protein
MAGEAAGIQPSGYAELLLTADRNFTPPAPAVFDWMDSITMLEPLPGSTVEGRVRVRLAVTGAVSQMRFFLDGQRFHTLLAPPFEFNWSTAKYSEGPHVIRVAGLNKKDQEVVSLLVGVTMARQAGVRGRR